MSKQTSNTLEQLQKLIKTHVRNDAAKPVAVLPPPPVAVAAPAPLTPTSTTTAAPASKPIVTMPASVPSRYSLRLLTPEIAKINSIIQNTLEQTGERVTLTDVLRVGIGRVGDSTPITRHEIVYLRKNDGRRTKSKG